MSDELTTHTIIFGDVEIYLPNSLRAVMIARKLLDLLEGDIPKPETLRNVSRDRIDMLRDSAKQLAKDNPEPFKNISQSLSPKDASVENLDGNAKTQSQIMKPDIPGTPDNIAPPAKAASLIESGEPETRDNMTVDSHSTGATFIFKECEPFKWFGLPTFRAGKTIYHMQQGKVHISREGYESLVYASIEDLKRLKDILLADKNAFSGALPFKPNNNKYQLLHGFLRDVNISTIGSYEHRLARKEQQEDEGMSNRRVPLTEDERNEICPECGHDRGLHHNPDDRCCETGCDCGYYFYGPKKKADVKDSELPQNDIKCDKVPQDTTKCPKCGSTERWKSGIAKAKTGRFQKYQCKEKKCGHVYVGERIAEAGAVVTPAAPGRKPTGFVVRAGEDGPLFKADEISAPVHIPEYKNRKERVQEGLAEGLTNEQISEKYNVPLNETNMLVNIIKKNMGGK